MLNEERDTLATELANEITRQIELERASALSARATDVEPIDAAQIQCTGSYHCLRSRLAYDP